MDTKDTQEKLQKAYQSMLQHIEELVDKDQKSLKEAFKEAEEKLDEWKELSREEIEKVSDELKSNMKEFGNASYFLNESLKETLSFDKAYLANSIWNSLSKVADNTRVEFNEFTEDLFQHMAMDTSHHSEQQKMWFDDGLEWRGNYEKSLKQLDELRASVRQKITKATRYCKYVSEETSNQGEHDLHAQMNKEITEAIDELHHRLLGDKGV